MTDWMKSWDNFLTENKEPIEEATEEEIGELDDILLKLDPKDLSFNNIFGDKMRVAIPLGTEGIKTETEKFLNAAGYTVDMKTGIATGYTMSSGEGRSKNTRMLSLDQQESFVTPEGKINVANLSNPTDPEKIAQMQRNLRRRQMKIGKLLKKGLDLAGKIANIPDGIENDEAKLDALTRYSQFFVEPSIGTPGQAREELETFKTQLQIWEKRGAMKSGHTIIITRHPIDVFRMSDFDRIQSCHSPPSREGDASYYKCAVAEAHGHGPVAYLVRNEDLDEALEEKELDKGDYQALLDQYEDDEEEFFYDDERVEGEITPINRLRIRKYSSPKFNMTIAVPAKRVYGDDRGFGDAMVNSVVKWAQGSQEDALKKMKDDEDMLSDGKFNMDNWIRHGGTYHQDNSPETLLRQLLDDDRFENLSDFTGYIQVDSTTENSLTLTAGVPAVTEQAEEMVDDFNRRSHAARVTMGDVDAEDGQFYISINEAVIVVKIPEDEFTQSAFTDFTRNAIESIVDYMSEYLPVDKDERVYYKTHGGTVFIDVPFDMMSVNREGGTLAYGIDGLDELLSNIDRQDDQHEQYEEAVREALMIQGAIKGSPIQEFAKMFNDNTYYEWDSEMDDRNNPTDIEIETRQYVNLEDLVKKIPVTLDRNPTPGGLSTLIPVMFDGREIAEVARVYDNQDLEETNVIGYEVVSQEFEDKKSEPLPNLKAVIAHVRREITKMIVMGGPQKFGGLNDASREYHVAVREELRKATGLRGDYHYPNSSLYVSGPDSDDEYNMQYEIGLNDGSSEGQFNAAEKIVNDIDDEDELKTIFRRAFARVAKVPEPTNENVRNYFKKFDIFG